MISELRNSTFEGMRIVAMSFIVFYHLVCAFLYRYSQPYGVNLLTAILPSLHVGVLLFVFISGFWGICPSLRGLVKLLLTVAICYLPLEIVNIVRDGDFAQRGFWGIVRNLEFISYTPYWFVRTYLYLYLLSPILNLYWERSDNTKRWYLLAVLGIISVVIGNSTPWHDWQDFNYADGKNFVNFAFLYVIGRMLRSYESLWKPLRTSVLLSVYLMYNAAIIFLLYRIPLNTEMYELVMRQMFNYNSIFLVINSVLLFLLLGRREYCSKIVNYVAGAMFMVYLIHCQPRVEHMIIDKAVLCMADYASGNVLLLLLLLPTVFLGCILVYIMLKPVLKLSRMCPDFNVIDG